MKKFVFAVFMLAWCTCFAAGQNDELFRRALSEQNENRWYEISDRFGGKGDVAWEKGYSDRIWNQISEKIVSPDIMEVSGSLYNWSSESQKSMDSFYSRWESEADAVYEKAVCNLPHEVKLQVAAKFNEYKKRIQKEFEALLLASQRRSALLTEASATDGIKPILDNLDMVLADLEERIPESDDWFTEVDSIIQSGKNSASEKAAEYFSQLEETIEKTKVALGEESQAFQDALEAVYDRFSKLLELKARATANEKALREEKARQESYLKNQKTAEYEAEANYWADVVRQCALQEEELWNSLETIKVKIRESGVENCQTVQSIDPQEMVQCQDFAEKVQALLYLSKTSESVQESFCDYQLKSELAQRNVSVYMSHLFSDADDEAKNFVQKMNNTLLHDFSLAYYYRSQDNPGFKIIEVTLYSDQNYQKLKSYGYAFSHPEEYVNSKTKAAYNAIASDPEKKRLYEFFESAVNNGTAQFDISFIGKDISELAHDYLWDVSVKKEKHYKKHHKVYNFLTRKSSKMKSMRKTMADIDGDAEREDIMGMIENVRAGLVAKDFYDAAGKQVLGDSVLYTYDSFLLKCREVSGVTFSGDSILQDYFNSLSDGDRVGFCEVLQNLSDLVMSSYSLNSLSDNAASYTIDLLYGIDDFGSSANRLAIMKLTGSGLIDVYNRLSASYIGKLYDDMRQDQSMLETAMTGWSAALDQRVYRLQKNWEAALSEMEKRKNEWELEQKQMTKPNRFIEETDERQTYLDALKIASEVDAFENQLLCNIETANKKTDKKITDLLEGKGYVRNGSFFKRKIIIDETILGGIEYENQKIEGYRWFKAPSLELGVDLSPYSIKEISLEELQDRIEKAETAIDQYSQVVFGKSDSKVAAGWENFSQVMLECLRQSEKDFSVSAQYTKYSDIKGLFAMHIGYVPVMSNSNPEKVVQKGYGEYGRIFELFYKNEARLGRGLAAIDVPFYMQKLWDEDGDNDGKTDNILFSLPSIRQGGEIVCNIFSSINPALGMMVTGFDSTTFAGLDMVFAGKSLEEAAGDVNKRMAAAASSWGTGTLAKAAQPAASASTGTRVLQSAAVSIGKEYANQVAVSAADGDLSEKDLKPDAKRGFGNLVRNWISSRLSGYLGEDQLAVEQVASFAGTLTDAGYDLATTGKAKFNVLNLSSFCDAHVGLLEMNIGGEGPIFEIGTGGYDISRERVENALESAYILQEDNRIRHSSDFSKNNKITMRALFSEGKIQEQVGELYNLLLNDGASVKYGDLAGALAYTSSDSQGSRNIILDLIPSNKVTDQLKTAVILAHEAYRNGKDDGILQIFETADAVVGHAKMAYDILSSGFSYPDFALIKEEVKSIIGGNIKDLIVKAICNYASGGDYWRIIGDGKVAWDGNLNLYQENGDLLYNYQKLREALQSGVESVSGVSQDRLLDIVWKNTLLEMAGTRVDGSYTSQAAEALLGDGYMSYDEAMNALSDTASKTFAVPDVFQHYSARIVANDTTLLEKIFASPEMLNNWSDRSQPVQYLNGVKATLLPDSKSVFHISPEDKATYKWVLDDGRELVIGERKDGTKYVQTDDHYLGTYNMANPDNPLEHAVKDVFPYALLGNTPDDSSIANFLFSL